MNWPQLMMRLPSSADGSHLLAGKGLSSSSCSCFKTQLLCIARLCGPIADRKRGLDTVLETARDTIQQIGELLSCHSCSKSSTSFVLTVVFLQRLVCIFCDVAKNAPTYLKAGKLGVGMFQLCEEEDQQHKKLLIISAARRVETVVSRVQEALRTFQQRELQPQKTGGEMNTDMVRSNVQWVSDAIQRMKWHLRTVITVVEGPEWV